MLNYRDTQVVRGMLKRGDRQHDIAAYFGVNAGRIAEIANGKDAYPTAQPDDPSKLPPPGPYLTKFAMHSVIRTLNEAIEVIDMAEAEEKTEDLKAALVLAKETLQAKIDALEETRAA
jgi:hypothetical protein